MIAQSIAQSIWLRDGVSAEIPAWPHGFIWFHIFHWVLRWQIQGSILAAKHYTYALLQQASQATGGHVDGSWIWPRFAVTTCDLTQNAIQKLSGCLDME